MTFGTLALVVAVGLVGPLLSLLPTRAAPPIVIGEIAAGVVVGISGTKTIDPTQPTLVFLADIGFALLMFIVGTNLPIRDRRLGSCARTGTIATVLTIALAAATAPLVAYLSGFHRPGVLAVLIAATSAAVALPITQTLGPSRPLLVTITWIAIVDTLTVLAVPLVLATGSVARTALGSALVIAGAAVIGFVGPLLGRAPAVEALRHASHRRAWALDLRVSLLVLFTLAWIAERFDTSVLIAGFAAGVMVAAIGEPRRVADQLIGLGEGFFVPLFFVVLGARIDVRSLVHSTDDLRLLALLAFATCAVPLVVAKIVRLPAAFGLLAAAELGVPAAVASIGLASHDLRAGQAAAIVGAAAISLAVASYGAYRAGATASAWADETPS